MPVQGTRRKLAHTRIIYEGTLLLGSFAINALVNSGATLSSIRIDGLDKFAEHSELVINPIHFI